MMDKLNGSLPCPPPPPHGEVSDVCRSELAKRRAEFEGRPQEEPRRQSLEPCDHVERNVNLTHAAVGESAREALALLADVVSHEEYVVRHPNYVLKFDLNEIASRPSNYVLKWAFRGQCEPPMHDFAVSVRSRLPKRITEMTKDRDAFWSHLVAAIRDTPQDAVPRFDAGSYASALEIDLPTPRSRRTMEIQDSWRNRCRREVSRFCEHELWWHSLAITLAALAQESRQRDADWRVVVAWANSEGFVSQRRLEVEELRDAVWDLRRNVPWIDFKATGKWFDTATEQAATIDSLWAARITDRAPKQVKRAWNEIVASEAEVVLWRCLRAAVEWEYSRPKRENSPLVNLWARICQVSFSASERLQSDACLLPTLTQQQRELLQDVIDAVGHKRFHFAALTCLTERSNHPAESPLEEWEHDLNRQRRRINQIHAALDEAFPPSPTESDNWPPDDGWHFAPGKAAFQRKAFAISGVSYKLLTTLVASRLPQSLEDLVVAVWEDRDTDPKTVRVSLTNLRNLLRKEIGFPGEFNPIPKVDAGENGGWQLHESLRPRRAK